MWYTVVHVEPVASLVHTYALHRRRVNNVYHKYNLKLVND